MEFLIGKTKVGGENPVFIVAEIGINHDGKYEQAIELIDIAKNAGCDAVKFQLFSAEKMYAKNAGQYKKSSGEKGDIFKLVKKAELPHLWILRLKKYAEENDLEFFATACDEQSADILEKYNASAYKVASYEITHTPLLRHIAKKQKPILFSSGGAGIQEIEQAVAIFKQEKNKNIALLHCIAKYPAPLKSLNLNVISEFKQKFPKLVIGYSDHSLDPVSAPVAAVVLGAKIIEKHITKNRNLPGSDHYCAINPEELRLMVKSIREAEKKLKDGVIVNIDKKLLGFGERKIFKEEQEIRSFAYRCIFATKNIKKGSNFSKNNTAVLRSGFKKRGLEPAMYDELIKNYSAKKNIKANQSIKKTDIAENNPRVTVIVRTYNSENFVEKAVKSILNQTITKNIYNILVVDDGSRDKTKSILKKFGKKITLICQKHQGPMRALNNGIKKAKGKNIIILDSDDIFEKKALEKLLSALEKNPNAGFAYCDYYEIKNGKKKRIFIKKNIFLTVAGGILFKKSILQEAGGYDEDMIFPEYDLLFKIKKRFPGVYVPLALFNYVRRPESLTANKKAVVKGMKQLFDKYGKIKGIKKY